MKKVLLFLLLALPVAVAGVLVVRARAQASEYREQARIADSIAAANDTARMVLADALDSTENAYELRIVQVRDSVEDDLSAEIGRVSVLLAQARLRMDTIRLVDTVMPEPTATPEVERYPVDTREGPFRVSGTFTRRVIGDAPEGLMELGVTLEDDVPVSTHVGCSPGPGYRSATLTHKTEHPFSLVPTGVTQDEDVCNAPPATPFEPSWLPHMSVKGVARDAVILLIGYAIGHGTDDGFRVARYER